MREEIDSTVFGRMQQIQDLENFITSKRKKFSDVLQKMGFSEDFLNKEQKVKCPYNAGHWIPESALSKHMKICSTEDDFYLKEDLEKQPPSSHFFYTNSTSTVPVLFGKEQLTQIISQVGESSGQTFSKTHEIQHMPRTMDRYIAEFTPKERCAIYDYVVEKGKATNKPAAVTVEDLMFDFESKKEDNDSKPKTKLEMLAEERDYKRRRQSYRAKNVHLTKKSYTEVMREVIENQTNFLAEVIKQEEKSADGSQKSDRQENVNSDDQSERSEKSVSDRESRRPHHRSSSKYSPDHRRHHYHHKHRRSRSRSSTRHKHKKHKKH